MARGGAGGGGGLACAVAPAAASGGIGSPRAAFGSPRRPGRYFAGRDKVGSPRTGVRKAGGRRVLAHRALAVRIPGDPAAVPRAVEVHADGRAQVLRRCAFCHVEDAQDRLIELCACDGGGTSGWAHRECKSGHVLACAELCLPRRACGLCRPRRGSDRDVEVKAASGGSSKDAARPQAEAALKSAWLHVLLGCGTERDRMILLLWGLEFSGPWAAWVAKERPHAGRAAEDWYAQAFPSTAFRDTCSALPRTVSWERAALGEMWRRVESGAASPRDHQILLMQGPEYPGPWSKWAAERQAHQRHPFGRRLLREEARRILLQRAELEALGRFRRSAPPRLIRKR